mgnify:CR=1 FL=1
MPGPYKGGGCLTTRSHPLSAAPRLRPSWPSWCIRARRCGACRACPCGHGVGLGQLVVPLVGQDKELLVRRGVVQHLAAFASKAARMRRACSSAFFAIVNSGCCRCRPRRWPPIWPPRHCDGAGRKANHKGENHSCVPLKPNCSALLWLFPWCWRWLAVPCPRVHRRLHRRGRDPGRHLSAGPVQLLQHRLRCCGAGHRRDRVRRQSRAEGHLHRYDQRRGCHRRRQ